MNEHDEQINDTPEETLPAGVAEMLRNVANEPLEPANRAPRELTDDEALRLHARLMRELGRATLGEDGKSINS